MLIHPQSPRDAIRLPKPPAHPPTQRTSPTLTSGPLFSGKGSDHYLRTGFSHPDDPVAVKAYLLDANPMVVIPGIAPKTKNPEVIKLLAQTLVKQGLDIDTPVFGGTGATLLHCAVGSGRPEFVEILLKMGANPAIQDKRGENSLNWLEDRVKAGTSRQDRQTIEKLLTSRLVKIAQPRPQQEAQSSGTSSSWMAWLFGGNSPKQDVNASTSAVPQPKSAPPQKAYVNSQAQTDEYVSPREQALSEKLDAMQQSLQNTQRKLDKLSPLKERLTEAQEKNQVLQRQLSPLKKGNSTLQSGNSHLQTKLGSLEEKLATVTDDKIRTEQRLNDEKAAGAQSEHDLRQQVETLQQALAKKQHVESKLAELEEKDHAQSAKSKKRQKDDQRQIKKLQQENSGLRQQFESQVSDLQNELAIAKRAQQEAQDNAFSKQKENVRLHQQLATQRQAMEDRKLVNTMQNALFRSNDPNELRKVIQLLAERDVNMPKDKPKDPSKLLQALSIDQPLPPEAD